VALNAERGRFHQVTDQAVSGGAAGDFLGRDFLGRAQGQVCPFMPATLQERAGGVHQEARLALGYVDPGEDGAAAAAREVEEETGWRPRAVEFLLTFQPVIGSADAPQDVYVAHGADLVGEPEIDEAEAVRWVPLGEAQEMIRRGEIVGAATVIGVMHAVAERAGPPRHRT